VRKSPAFSFYPIPFKDEPLSESIARLARLGYDGIELPGEPEVLDLRDVNRLVSDAGLIVTAICPRIYGPERDLTSSSLSSRRSAVDYFRSLVDQASTTQSPTVIVAPTAVRRTLPETSGEREWEWAVSGLQDIAAYAAPAGIRLAIEPWNRYETYLVNRIEDALRLAADVGSGNVGVMGDLFHMNIEEVDMADALRSAGDRLFNVHFADSNRRAPGAGHIPLASIMMALHEIGYRNTISVEYLPPKYIFDVRVPDEYYEPYAAQTIDVLRNSWQSTSQEVK
jgi:sugar phosphate isomerase/epimerase